ncbi:8673_t:CDS:2, partial [Acaulospora morrowiae]
SFNVNLPTLLIKRYRRGTMSKFSLDSFITTPEGRDRYLDRVHDDGGKYQHDIIVFDETMDETDKVSSGWTLLSVLERAMLSFHHTPSSENIDENCDIHRGRVYWLKGGFEAFRSWDKCKEFLVSGLEVGETCDHDESSEGTTMDLEIQGQGAPGLVRRDSLFSVNTERNSLRRKRSDKQSDENHPQSPADPAAIKQSELSRGRRASNGLQYLFPQTNSDRRLSENLSLYSAGAHNQFMNTVKTNNLDGSLDSPSTPAPITHPETTFIVSTIIPNFLYLGPEISKKEEVEEIEAKGIKRILNMAFECTDTLGLNEKFDQYLKLNVKDSVEEDVESGLKIAVSFIEQAERDQMPVYVHCKAGKSRSVTAVLAFLIKSRKWTLKRAYDYVMERRSGICPNIGFVAELMRVEEVVLGIKRNNGLDLGEKKMTSMEGIELLKKKPHTAFF